ncbi:MAG: ATP synthase F1 subunit delta [Muribaculaceae bacterium]|nr:ATP synthase F1 subunit delta [Muribaculaceae bacterium]
MDQGLLPRRYAKALYKYAAEKDATAGVYALMQRISAAFSSTPGLQKALANPFVSDADKQQLAASAAGTVPGKDPILDDFVSLLIRNHRIDLLHETAIAYEMLYRRTNNIYSVNIESAAPLSDSDRSRITSLVERHLHGATAEYSFTVDPDLIGGFVVNIENERLDASVRNELEQMRQHLIS